MKIAVIDKKDITIQVQNNSIKFLEHNIPFSLIDLLILNHKVTLNSADILKLTKNNINILLVSYNNENFSLISSANTKNANLKLSQYNALNFKLHIAKYIITQKITTHAQHLKKHNITLDISKELLQIQNIKSTEELLGIEGTFAKTYFKYFFSLISKKFHKEKRSKHPPLDPVNALMSYWYSLFYNLITAKLLSYGFEPSIGYLHIPFRTHNALSSDLLELFRAEINEAVIFVFKKDTLSIQDFTKKNKGVYLKYEGRRKIWQHFVELSNLLKPKIDSQIAYLKKLINEKDTNS